MWVSRERLSGLADEGAMWHVTPEFVIELESASDRTEALRAKMREWTGNGVPLAWLIIPETRTVEIYRSNESVEVLSDALEVRGEGCCERFCAADGAHLGWDSGVGDKIMRVAKWGESLAVRIPAAMVQALEIEKGHEIEISVAGAREIKESRGCDRETAVESLRRLARPLPAGFKFEREQANER